MQSTDNNTYLVTLSVTATTTTVITATDTQTSTSTVGTPLITVHPAKRHDRVPLPPFLECYRAPQISSACSKLVKDLIQTKTTTRTQLITRVPSTNVKTQTKTVATNTILVTATPDTVTVTNVVATTVVTENTTVTTTTVTTVCPSATFGVSGISVDPPGGLRFPIAATPVECCTACFAAPGCVGWAWLGPLCAFGVGSPPNIPPVTAQCPFGLGGFMHFTGGSPELAGGPGPCFG